MHMGKATASHCKLVNHKEQACFGSQLSNIFSTSQQNSENHSFFILTHLLYLSLLMGATRSSSTLPAVSYDYKAWLLYYTYLSIWGILLHICMLYFKVSEKLSKLIRVKINKTNIFISSCHLLHSNKITNCMPRRRKTWVLHPQPHGDLDLFSDFSEWSQRECTKWGVSAFVKCCLGDKIRQR